MATGFGVRQSHALTLLSQPPVNTTFVSATWKQCLMGASCLPTCCACGWPRRHICREPSPHPANTMSFVAEQHSAGACSVHCARGVAWTALTPPMASWAWHSQHDSVAAHDDATRNCDDGEKATSETPSAGDEGTA